MTIATKKTSMKSDPIYSEERKEAAIYAVLRDYLQEKYAEQVDDKCDS